MRYHYQRPLVALAMYGRTHTCNHLIYSRCTLYKIREKGLAVIQQRFNYQAKMTYWDEIDQWLVDDIYTRDGFKAYFDKYASEPVNDIYPTVTVRQIMWALKMKPLEKEPWETVFDHAPI